MFLEHWKLREQPFGVTPDPRYLYFSAGHREALASVFCGIEMGRGFLSLIARPGMGKTTLIFQLLRRWKGHVQSAFLFQTQCNSRELIRYLLGDLGLNNDSNDIVKMHGELNEFLVREAKAGKRVVVFIDEAQNLPDEVLETVRLLSNFEASDRKLLQIVLAGQPELAQRLSSPSLAQLSQRIAVNARLDPLPPAEVVQYIKHRLSVAGGENPELFTPGALGAVAELSQGVPRLVNAICFNALSLGVAARRDQVNLELVSEAARDLHLKVSGKTVKAQARPQQLHEAPQLIASHRSFWESLGSRIRDLVSRRLVQASGLCLMFGVCTILFTGNKQGGAAPRGDGHGSPISAVPVRAESPAPLLSPAKVVETPVPVVQPTSVPEISPGSFGYEIQPHDTIRSLCISAYKRYDDEILAEIRRLNPGLKDINHLEVGQEIQLPLITLPKRPPSSP